jgi:hypothetical protein
MSVARYYFLPNRNELFAVGQQSAVVLHKSDANSVWRQHATKFPPSTRNHSIRLICELWREIEQDFVAVAVIQTDRGWIRNYVLEEDNWRCLEGSYDISHLPADQRLYSCHCVLDTIYVLFSNGLMLLFTHGVPQMMEKNIGILIHEPGYRFVGLSSFESLLLVVQASSSCVRVDVVHSETVAHARPKSCTSCSVVFPRPVESLCLSVCRNSLFLGSDRSVVVCPFSPLPLRFTSTDFLQLDVPFAVSCLSCAVNAQQMYVFSYDEGRRRCAWYRQNGASSFAEHLECAFAFSADGTLYKVTASGSVALFESTESTTNPSVHPSTWSALHCYNSRLRSIVKDVSSRKSMLEQVGHRMLDSDRSNFTFSSLVPLNGCPSAVGGLEVQPAIVTPFFDADSAPTVPVKMSDGNWLVKIPLPCVDTQDFGRCLLSLNFLPNKFPCDFRWNVVGTFLQLSLMAPGGIASPFIRCNARLSDTSSGAIVCASSFILS